MLASCLALLALQTPIAAKTIFDGSWRVTATTTQGSCDRSVGYRVVIIDGRVLSGDVTGVSGSITASGSITVTVHRKSGTVFGTGHMGASSGAGRWTAQSSSGRCVGEWQAQRVP
ncbi:MAG: hypothetical protein ACHQAY_12760 [Hyphomicrobiales bacterium]